MPTDTKPTTREELEVYARSLEDELALLKAKPPAPAITPSTSQAIAAKLQGKVAPAQRPTPRGARPGVRAIARLNGHLFVGVITEDTPDFDATTGALPKVRIELKPAGEVQKNGKQSPAWVELVCISDVLLAPEHW